MKQEINFDGSVLEILQDRFRFLRFSNYNYLFEQDDIYISSLK